MFDGLLGPHVFLLMASYCDEVVTRRGQCVHCMDKIAASVLFFVFFSPAHCVIVMLMLLFVVLKDVFFGGYFVAVLTHSCVVLCNKAGR